MRANNVRSDTAKSGKPGFKSEYKTPEGRLEVYNETGEYFCAGTTTKSDQESLIVQPVSVNTEYY